MKLQVLSLLVGHLITTDLETPLNLFLPIQNLKKLIVDFEIILTELICNLLLQNLTIILPGCLAVLRTLAHY